VEGVGGQAYGLKDRHCQLRYFRNRSQREKISLNQVTSVKVEPSMGVRFTLYRRYETAVCQDPHDFLSPRAYSCALIPCALAAPSSAVLPEFVDVAGVSN
jgi:hypothetical protein